MEHPQTDGEWRVQVGMEIKQISTDVGELKEGFKDLANMEKNIQADLQILKRDEKRTEQLEEEMRDLTRKHSSLAGQFKIVVAVLSLAMASMFGWVFSRSAPAKPAPIIIKLDKTLIDRLSK